MMVTMNEPTALFRIVSKGEPRSKARPRFTKTGRVYTPKRTVDAEEALGWLVREQYSEPPDSESAFRLDAVFYFGTRQVRDLDNMVKLINDAWNGIVWADDRQITEIHAWMIRDTSDPRTEATVYRLGAFDEDRPAIVCEECGKSVSTYPSWEGRRFCSRECSVAGKRSGKYIHCAQCKKPVYREPGRLKSGRTQFCSVECKSAHGTVEKECVVCAAPFSLPKSWRNNRVTCSRSCSVRLGAQRSFQTGKRKPRSTCKHCGNPVSRREYTRCQACYVKQRYGERVEILVEPLEVQG
jgi:Holliday junction resolvase RusA-like endonuclease/endogenous inhibitor of DNA gyrase (YacG/DUF329 family)